MTKREFLKELEDRLQMLDEKERKDMIEEYSQHISMCMKSGMKEEEAIEDFGDMDDLIAEILEAYHLDPEYEVKSRERSGKTGIEELAKRIEDAVAALPESYREAFVMHRFRDMSYKEIAETLGVSPKTIDYRIQQALKQLRVDLKDYLPLLLPLLFP